MQKSSVWALILGVLGVLGPVAGLFVVSIMQMREAAPGGADGWNALAVLTGLVLFIAVCSGGILLVFGALVGWFTSDLDGDS